TAAPAVPGYTVVTSLGNAIIPGTALVPGTNCDDCTQPVAFPFPVTFYGTTYASANVSSNGNLQFVSNDPTNIPDPGRVPDPKLATAILVFFSDLTASVGPGLGTYSATVGVAPNRQFVLEWRTTLFAHTDITVNGEIVFYENSPVISLIYGTSSDLGAMEASGIPLAPRTPPVHFSPRPPPPLPHLPLA